MPRKEIQRVRLVVPEAELPGRLHLLKLLQAQLEDQGSALCLAPRIEAEYKPGETCGQKAAEKRHTVSKSYLRSIASDGQVLSVFPIDAEYVANLTKADGRIGGKGLEDVTLLPPKPTRIKEASTWHFACQYHDGLFKPVDLGIRFPICRKYTSIQTRESTEGGEELEDALFLQAYRTVLSTLSTLRGARETLRQLRKAKWNVREILLQSQEIYERYRRIESYKLRFDGRFSKAGECNMVHHLVPVSPHTRMALGYLDEGMAVSVLPGDGGSWLIVSHLTDDDTKVQGKVEELVNDMPKKLADPDNKIPLIEFVSSSFGAFISPEDYDGWDREDKEVLGNASAQWLTKWI